MTLSLIHYRAHVTHKENRTDAQTICADSEGAAELHAALQPAEQPTGSGRRQKAAVRVFHPCGTVT